MSKYALGIDYGTESGRVLLVRLEDGKELASHATRYPHGVIDERLPDTGEPLGADWALQHPDDYLEVLRRSIPEALRQSGVPAEQVVGIGVAFTACTLLPVDLEGTPLCLQKEWKNRPHSWVKLWKHHAAYREAERIQEIAAQSGETFMTRYGGSVSSEWAIPKIWQVLREAPDIYAAAARFMEAGDWIVRQLTGETVRNACSAGYKGFWHKTDGNPSPEFLAKLDPRLADLMDTKLRGEPVAPGRRAGGLVQEMADLLGLSPGTAVGAATIDAHAGVPGTGVAEPNKLVMAMGTSSCHMLIAEEERHPEGICGVVEDGIVPGYYGYEAGQPAVGDCLAWFVDRSVPAYAEEEARAEGLRIHTWLERKAAVLRPGESGLLALDWWNGNRSVLADSELSGLIAGYTLRTRPEEVYRALIEATAFGTRRIIDSFETAGLPVKELYACGGLPRNNRLLMQIYADVTGRTIRLAASAQPTALGAAMLGAVAAGAAAGGFDTLREAAGRMAPEPIEEIRPNAEHKAIYDELYAEYVTLHELLGREESGFPVLKRLKRLQLQARSR